MSNVESMHLYHGGHKGTEAAFGAAAERWGIAETTISFEGHVMERAQNVEVLDDDTLREGRVSMEFVFQTLGRRFARGKGLRRVMTLRTRHDIWNAAFVNNSWVGTYSRP